eukprot:548638-Amphidinium_carterae.1
MLTLYFPSACETEPSRGPCGCKTPHTSKAGTVVFSVLGDIDDLVVLAQANARLCLYSCVFNVCVLTEGGRWDVPPRIDLGSWVAAGMAHANYL